MSREFRIFEVDQYDNRFFVARQSTAESAIFYVKRMKPGNEKWIIVDEHNVEHMAFQGEGK